jgi:hypothetical protein
MLRLSRPLTLALLWLAIALLPMRGWAAAVMPVVVTAQTGDAAMPAPADAGGHDGAMPCHGGTADGAGTPGNGGCAHCAVCHGATAVMPSASLPLTAAPEAHPGLEAPPGIERPVHSGPERPPRNQRA